VQYGQGATCTIVAQAHPYAHISCEYRFAVPRRSKLLSCVNADGAINQFILDQLGKFGVAEYYLARPSLDRL
jgi:hypothetical protein